MANGTAIVRSRMVTLLAWVLMAAGALVTPVSAIALLMLVAGSDGSQSTTLSGFFVVVVLPPATVLAGFGLWRRWRWAHLSVLLLLAGIAAWNVARMLRGPTESHIEVSPTGVPTHVLGSEVDYPRHATAALVALGVLAALLVPAVRREFSAPATAAAPGAARPRSLAPMVRAAHEHLAADAEALPAAVAQLRTRGNWRHPWLARRPHRPRRDVLRP